ncbi:serine hydrolase, partial [Staphylococcus aureus]|uniref:serine hydrolase n=1 Tax=Staphylococcus aureus TaxID=1280 RepID=UPI0039BE512F
VYNEAVKKNYETIPFETPSSLKNGTAYKVSTLLEKMIVDSDNGAKDLLLENMSDEYLTGIYTDLGLVAPADDGSYLISAKSYSLFLRILYNASYLNNENSEFALKLLSQATFKNGLVKDLPEGTIVAHKFGEHINSTN